MKDKEKNKEINIVESMFEVNEPGYYLYKPVEEIDNSPPFTPLDIKDIIRLSIIDFVKNAKENKHLSLDELKDLYFKENKL